MNRSASANTEVEVQATSKARWWVSSSALSESLENADYQQVGEYKYWFVHFAALGMYLVVGTGDARAVSGKM